ncbi:MAG: transporter substrate-binding domain-containing protein [Pseudomonadales bacterium]|nr:transporter substrate-binding domain-containing protein [Pseudomonadales bacterium]NRA16714.1 transporter substrate-binding domain-containing protein [Oceanospirillaceae bacterium]
MKWLIPIIAIVLISRLSFAEEIEVNIMVNDSHPPYVYTDEGDIKGIYIEVLKRVSQRMSGYTLTFTPAPWLRVKKLIQVGTALAFVPPYYHGHDWLYVWPYSISIMDESVVVVCRKDILKTARPNWPEDYVGLIVANNSGYDGFGGATFRKFVKEGTITLAEAKTTQQNLLRLVRKRVDCYMGNQISVQWRLKTMLNSGDLTVAEKESIVEAVIISTDAVYMGFTDRDNGRFYYKRDFVQKFNNEIYKMKKHGEIIQIYKEYFK